MCLCIEASIKPKGQGLESWQVDEHGDTGEPGACRGHGNSVPPTLPTPLPCASLPSGCSPVMSFYSEPVGKKPKTKKQLAFNKDTFVYFSTVLIKLFLDTKLGIL